MVSRYLLGMALIAVASAADVGAAPPAADTAAVDVINAPPSPINPTSTASRFAEAVSLAAGATGGAGAPTDRPFPTVADIAAVGSPPKNACFDACPQPKDVKSDCYLKCYDKADMPRFAEVRSRAARVAEAQANLKTREDVQTESKKKRAEEDMITGTFGSNVWDAAKNFFKGRWGGLGRKAKNAGWFSVAAFR